MDFKGNANQDVAKAVWYLKDYLADHGVLQDTVNEAELLGVVLDEATEQDEPWKALSAIASFLFTHDFEYLHIALERLDEHLALAE
jgi:hypothetical protein